MAQTYEKSFSRIKGNLLTLVTGTNYLFAKVFFPPSGYLVRYLVQQATGTSVGFTADILSSHLGLLTLQTSGPYAGLYVLNVVGVTNNIGAGNTLNYGYTGYATNPISGATPGGGSVVQGVSGIQYGDILSGSLPAGWQQYLLWQELNASAGGQVQMLQPAGIPYRNQDGPDPIQSGLNASGLGAGFTNAQRAVYLLLKPGSNAGANSTWEFSISCYVNVGE